MPGFRQRPLTWLFIGATLCLDAAGAIRAPEAVWFEGILAGQLLMASAWAVLGQGHRLAGGAIWITSLLGVTWLASFGARVAVEWRYVLGSALFMTAATMGCSLLWRTVLERIKPSQRKARIQFPVAELFGWTIIVAMGTTAFRQAIGVHLREVSYSGPILAMAATASFVLAVFIAPARPRVSVAAILAALAVGLLYASGLSGWFSWLGVVRTDIITLGYVTAWILTIRLDESSPSVVAASGPQSLIQSQG